MKRLLIVQPLVNIGNSPKTPEEIVKERHHAIDVVKNKFGEDVEVIDSFIEGIPQDTRPLWYLSKQIEILSTADVVVFCNGWTEYRGYRIERMIALQYNIDIVYDSVDVIYGQEDN